jgi:hypothetical protein
MIKRGRGRPQSSNSKVAIKKRLQRAKQEGRAVTLLGGLTITDGEAWFEILKEDTDLIPAFADKTNEPIILRATVALINDMCSEWRREQAEKKLAGIKGWSVGVLEREQPPELKDKGIRFAVVDLTDNRNCRSWHAIFNRSQHKWEWNQPSKRDRGRSLSAEEIAAWEAENPDLLSDGDDDSFQMGPARLMFSTENDEGYDDADDLMGGGDDAGFEDEAVNDEE